MSLSYLILKSEEMMTLQFFFSFVWTIKVQGECRMPYATNIVIWLSYSNCYKLTNTETVKRFAECKLQIMLNKQKRTRTTGAIFSSWWTILSFLLIYILSVLSLNLSPVFFCSDNGLQESGLYTQCSLASYEFMWPHIKLMWKVFETLNSHTWLRECKPV